MLLLYSNRTLMLRIVPTKSPHLLRQRCDLHATTAERQATRNDRPIVNRVAMSDKSRKIAVLFLLFRTQFGLTFLSS